MYLGSRGRHVAIFHNELLLYKPQGEAERDDPLLDSEIGSLLSDGDSPQEIHHLSIQRVISLHLKPQCHNRYC
jgi:hypothetical protein